MAVRNHDTCGIAPFMSFTKISLIYSLYKLFGSSSGNHPHCTDTKTGCFVTYSWCVVINEYRLDSTRETAEIVLQMLNSTISGMIKGFL